MRTILHKSRSFVTEKIPKSPRKNGIHDCEVHEKSFGILIVCRRNKKDPVYSAFLLLMIIIMTSAQVFSDHQYGEYVNEFETAIREQNGQFPPAGVPYYAQVPLHDRGFTIFPDLTEMRSWLPDMFLTSLLGLTIPLQCILDSQAANGVSRLCCGAAHAVDVGHFILFQDVVILVTTVPSPLRGCTGNIYQKTLPHVRWSPGTLN